MNVRLPALALAAATVWPPYPAPPVPRAPAGSVFEARPADARCEIGQAAEACGRAFCTGLGYAESAAARTLVHRQSGPEPWLTRVTCRQPGRPAPGQRPPRPRRFDSGDIGFEGRRCGPGQDCAQAFCRARGYRVAYDVAYLDRMSLQDPGSDLYEVTCLP